MQRIILVFSVTCTLQELQLYPKLIYFAILLSCSINTVFHTTSTPWRCIIGADSFPSAVP